MEFVRRKKTWTFFSQKAIRRHIPSVFVCKAKVAGWDCHWRCDLVDLWVLHLYFTAATGKGTLVHARARSGQADMLVGRHFPFICGYIHWLVPYTGRFVCCIVERCSSRCLG